MRWVRRVCFIALTAALAAAVSLSSTATVYYDVRSTDWFAPAAGFVVETGLFTGVSPGYFAPTDTMSRGMFYTVLSRAAGAEVDNTVPTNLLDVPANTWYTGAVIWALGSGLTECASEELFGVYEGISRAELCRALYRYDRHIGLLALPTAGEPAFPDLAGVDDETRTAIAACQAVGIIHGRTNGLFDPHATATRAEVAKMVQNFFTLPTLPPLPVMGETLEPWDAVGVWAGTVDGDFPLGSAEVIDAELVNGLNYQMLHENHPASFAPYGQSIDGVANHLTNFGIEGTTDCWHVTTILENRNNGVDAGIALNGRQEYYGYSLQTKGILLQDRWHAAAMESGKDPWQCTWWAWGRAAQYLETAHGLDLTEFCDGENNFGNGGSYYSGLKNYFLSDQTPSPNSIVSWRAGRYGHVAYVEAVDNGGIWVSMSDSGHAWRGVTYIPKGDDPNNPYPLHWYASESCNGFNHLDYAADGTPLE